MELGWSPKLHHGHEACIPPLTVLLFYFPTYSLQGRFFSFQFGIKGRNFILKTNEHFVRKNSLNPQPAIISHNIVKIALTKNPNKHSSLFNNYKEEAKNSVNKYW